VITWPPPGNGTWYKQGKFTHPSERLLCADSLFWLIESENQSTVGANGAIPGQNASYNTATYTAPGQTLYDFYRHGIYPASNGSTLNTSGGKVSFNILYADGHVSNVNDRKEGYRALRQRFPG
jgi:prepilin-type processing-associated H-X9-DG protein